MAKLCKVFGVDPVNGRPYSPQTQGGVERMVSWGKAAACQSLGRHARAHVAFGTPLLGT